MEIEIDLMKKVIGLVPDLEAVLVVIQKARSVKINYPISHWSDFELLFTNDEKSIRTESYNLHMGSAKRFFPITFFPISNEDDFINKLYISFAIGRSSHALNQQNPNKAIKEFGIDPEKIQEYLK